MELKHWPFLILGLSFNARAAELVASDGAAFDFFGGAASQSGGSALVGAAYDDSRRGSAYLFRPVDTASGTLTEQVKLVASDAAANDAFGSALSLSGETALIGSIFDDSTGSAYVFRGLGSASGTVGHDLKLVASDGGLRDGFGSSVSLLGSIGLVGSPGDVPGSRAIPGAAYLFRNLDTAIGTITEHAKLMASDGLVGDAFGHTVSLSGTMGLIAARGDDFGSELQQGSAYLFRNLDTATGTVTENAKLVASDGGIFYFFGESLGLSGNMAVVGAWGDNPTDGLMQGSAYLYRNLDTASGTVTEDAKLRPADLSESLTFGSEVSVSGQRALVAANPTTSTGNAYAYLFTDLDSASGTVNESVRFRSSDGSAVGGNMDSVALNGDQFVIGMKAGDGMVQDSGKAYTGSVASVTTLDAGNTARTIDGLSFDSRVDWVIGKSTDANQVTLGEGDAAIVAGSGKSVYIGQEGGADDNTLVIGGRLVANEVYVGSLSGNMGNTLRLENAAIFEALAVRLAPENFFMVPGDQTAMGDLLSFLGDTDLQVWTGDTWETVDEANHSEWIVSSFAPGTGLTTIMAVPEAGSWLLLGLGGVASLLRRNRQR